jgi:hypothetical protein
MSNNYFFKFDIAKEGELGYVMPEWVGKEKLLQVF